MRVTANSMNLHTHLMFFSGMWALQAILELVLICTMYYRKLQKVFPIFFAYLMSQVLFFSMEFPLFLLRNYSWYFYTYWVLQAISLALGFEVIHEIFLDVFRPYHALKDLGTVLFKWAALVMLLVAGVVAASSPAGQQGPLVQSVLTVQRCIRVIQCGLILFLLVFSKYLSVSWRQHSFGIALGFGGAASVELGLVAFNVSGHISQNVMASINIVAYDFFVLVWLAYAMLKSPAREAVTQLRTQRWDQSLSDLQHPATTDSLIPLFEGMVDRAFSRSHQETFREELPAPPAAKSVGAGSS